MKQIAIFKPGKHIAANGAAVEFSEGDLERSIAAYDPAIHEAPIVVGHPKDNGPAYGWVSKLSFADGEMMADVSQVDAEFAELVTAGRFKKRSASFYTPDAPTNPVPGVYYLRHVGFLGAQPPAVKGLREVAFAEDEGVVEFADDGMVTGILALMMRRLRDFFIAEYGTEKAQSVIPDFLVSDIEAEARKPAEPEMPISTAFSESTPEQTPEGDVSMTPEELATLQAKAARAEELEAQVAEYAEAQAKAARVAKVAGFKAELAALVNDGKVLPAEVDALAEFMTGLNDEAAVAEFAEGETQRTQLAWFRAHLAARPKAVDFSERAAGGSADDTPAKASDIAMKARAYRDAQAAKGLQISFTEATDAVLRGAAE